jgi:hypothetical protein
MYVLIPLPEYSLVHSVLVEAVVSVLIDKPTTSEAMAIPTSRLPNRHKHPQRGEHAHE